MSNFEINDKLKNPSKYFIYRQRYFIILKINLWLIINKTILKNTSGTS